MESDYCNYYYKKLSFETFVLLTGPYNYLSAIMEDTLCIPAWDFVLASSSPLPHRYCSTDLCIQVRPGKPPALKMLSFTQATVPCGSLNVAIVPA